MDSKIIIINPSDETYGLLDGDVNYIGEVDSDFYHGDLLIDYGINVYGEDSIFGILASGNYLVDVPVYFLTEGNDNIVFLNVSNSKNGKMGLLYLPNNISDKQKDSLNKLSSILDDFKIEVNYNLRMDDGIVDSDRHTMKGTRLFRNFHNQKKA
ncbi:MAG: hypothetical protein IKF91_04610 [Bacilli bacterium]|nr:hypothetical protein [Bacilli bacterium]